MCWACGWGMDVSRQDTTSLFSPTTAAAYHSVMLSAKPLRDSAPTNHPTVSGLKSANTKSSQRLRQIVYVEGFSHYQMGCTIINVWIATICAVCMEGCESWWFPRDCSSLHTGSKSQGLWVWFLVTTSLFTFFFASYYWVCIYFVYCI